MQSTTSNQVADQYAAAHEIHYKDKNLEGAVDAYDALVSAHPEAKEATYARSQVHNILKQLLSKDELFESEVATARARITEVAARAESKKDVEPEKSATPDAD